MVATILTQVARAFAVFVCLCVSVTRRYCIETAARIQLIFFYTGFSRSVLCCVLWKLGYLQNKGTSPWNYVPNSGRRKFRHGTPTVSECDINSDSGRSGVDSTGRNVSRGKRGPPTVNDRSATVDRTRRTAIYSANCAMVDLARGDTVARVPSA